MPSPNEHSIEEQCFEGPEKNLQIIFSKQESAHDVAGLRTVKQERWQTMLNKAKCKILSSVSNAKCTAFVLSESSLFVFDDRIIIKTCGATPLLYAVDDIIAIGREADLTPAAVLYWRKNFNNPHLQDPIHRDFKTETAFLDAHFGGIESHSHSATLGSCDKDHFHFYYNEVMPASSFNPVKKTFEVKMHELHPLVSEKFIWKECPDDPDSSSNMQREKIRPEVINKIQEQLHGYNVDEFFFEPCGYSMNGIQEDNYETIHITPEDCCSYMSFETNDEKYINTRIKEFRVLELFRPACCTTIQITPGKVSDDNLNSAEPENFNRVSSESVTLGNISIVFHSYETTEDHPMMTIAKLRQERIALIHASARKLTQ